MALLFFVPIIGVIGVYLYFLGIFEYVPFHAIFVYVSFSAVFVHMALRCFCECYSFIHK